MGNFLKKALPYAAGAVAGGVMNQFAPTKNYSALGAAAAGALTNKKNPLSGALQGAAGGAVGSGVGGMLNNKTGGNGFMEGLKTYGNSIPGFGGIGTSNPTGVFAKFLTPASAASAGGLTPTGNKMSVAPAPWRNSFGSPSSALLANTGSAVGTPASSVPGSSGIVNKDLFSKFMPQQTNMGKMALGAGVSMLPGMFQKDVPASDFSPVTNPLRDRINNPSTAGQAAMDTYLKTVQAPTGASAESAIANAKLISDRQRADNLRSINQQFQAAMPGADYTNSSAYQDAVTKMNAEMDQNYSAQAAQTQFEYDQMQKQQQLAAASALQSMDQAQIQALADLAQYDIYTIAEKTGYDLQKAQAVQDLAAKAGEYIMANAAGLNTVTS